MVNRMRLLSTIGQLRRVVVPAVLLWCASVIGAAQISGKASPGPVLTQIVPPSAAPGATITVYGRNLGPPSFVGPHVVFENKPTTMSQSARVINDSALSVVVPPGSGTTRVHVETAAGTSRAVTFMYKLPTITSLSPPSGGRDQVVAILGQGFGVKQSLDPNTFVKFGDSLATPVQWEDQRIVVKAPSDFGTGTNSNILLGLLGCAGGGGTASEAAKLVLDLALPGCDDLFTALVRRYQLQATPGFLQRQVPVVVRTTAGTSNQEIFSYRVAAEISGAPGAVAKSASAYPQGSTILIHTETGSVRVANFYRNVKGNDAYGGVILDQAPGYVISYNPQMYCSDQSKRQGCFGIDLSQSAVKADQVNAENLLMRQLGVSVSDFCKLPIAITSLEDKLGGSQVATPPSICPGGQLHFAKRGSSAGTSTARPPTPTTIGQVPVPEYYGIYAVVDGKLIKLDSQQVRPEKTTSVRLGRRNG